MPGTGIKPGTGMEPGPGMNQGTGIYLFGESNSDVCKNIEIQNPWKIVFVNCVCLHTLVILALKTNRVSFMNLKFLVFTLLYVFLSYYMFSILVFYAID